MKCPKCGNKDMGRSVGRGHEIGCTKCNQWSPEHEWNSDDKNAKSYRPKHYEEGHDTFAWAEHKFDLETNLAICQFNIHKYNDREKGQTKRDFEKIIDYAQRGLDLIKEDKMEVTFDEK